MHRSGSSLERVLLRQGGADNRLRGVEGTLWAAYDGGTEYLDHRKICQSADQRMVWEIQRIKTRALTVAVEMLPHFRN